MKSNDSASEQGIYIAAHWFTSTIIVHGVSTLLAESAAVSTIPCWRVLQAAIQELLQCTFWICSQS